MCLFFMFSPNTHTSHFLPGIIRENQQNQTLFSIKTISMVNYSSKNKSVLFFFQREFNPNTYTTILKIYLFIRKKSSIKSFQKCKKKYKSKKRISIYQQYQNNYTISPSLLDTTLKKEKYTL